MHSPHGCTIRFWLRPHHSQHSPASAHVLLLRARRAWRSWALSPQHMVHVVEAAWLLVALVFRQGDSCAAAMQVGAGFESSVVWQHVQHGGRFKPPPAENVPLVCVHVCLCVQPCSL